MKKVLFILPLFAVALMWSCGGSAQGEQSGTDSLAQDSTAVFADENVGESLDETVAETEEAQEDNATLNAALFGKFSNNNDPVIDLELSQTVKKFDAGRGYGYIIAANEYFEYDFTLVFTSITPEGDNIRVHYDKMESYFEGGDPDDYDSPENEGEWKVAKAGEGDLVLIPVAGGKVKIDSKEARIKNKVLSKS